jgi:hypothetical protein
MKMICSQSGSPLNCCSYFLDGMDCDVLPTILVLKTKLLSMHNDEAF